MQQKSTYLSLAVILLTVLFGTRQGSAATQESPHGPLNLTCISCHTTEGWGELRRDLKFDHQQTTFPLIGRHTGVACIACHTSLVFTEAGNACKDCHLDVHRGQFAQNSCEECHTPMMWSNEELMLARHQQTRFPLIGVHAGLDCQQCHADGQYVNVPVNCQGCHLQTYVQTTNPDHAAAGFPLDCRQCHTATVAKWANADFTHSADFPMTGGHANRSCQECHVSGFANTSTECFSCHASDYQDADDPDHAGNQFSHACSDCHSINAWQPATFNHDLSGFPLTGAHVTANCAACHVNGQYTGIPTACYDCHQDNYETAADPNHVAGNFDHNCAECHTTAGWAPASFDHSQSDFPLTGAHFAASCTQCHVDGQFTGTPTICFACHEQDYTNADNPDHDGEQFSQNCADCHNTDAWQPATFDHNQTEFPLTGAHTAANCIACHVDGQYAGTPTDCYACHQADFEGVSDPNHVTGNFDHACAQCHTTAAWSPASFDHAGTDFPLTGAHIAANCTECHIDGQFANTPTDCWSCHELDYNGANDPNHASNQYPHACADCHSTTAWEPSSFDHGQTTFPLTGAHVSVNCASCHVNGQFEGTPTACYDCHQQDFEGVSDPNHVSNQFSHDCLQCHTTVGWSPATFDHSQTQFPLTGAHVSVDCISCHVGGQFEGTPTDCYACHQDDYEETTDPNHVQAQFSHTCTECHNTTAWEPSTFDHNNTDFPLTGAHISASCSQCHIDGQYEGTPTDCFFCHESDYIGADDPNHQGAGFPTTCADCHTTSNWNSNFDHDGQYFPIYSGRHEGEWNVCADCHTNPNNYGIFSCIDCHEHNQQDMDNEHDEVPGYVWESNACLSCHPDGGGDLHRPHRVPTQK